MTDSEKPPVEEDGNDTDDSKLNITGIKKRLPLAKFWCEFLVMWMQLGVLLPLDVVF